MNRIAENINNIRNNLQNANYNNDFLNSNTIVSNFAFLILVVFMFVIVSALSMNLVNYFMSPEYNPKLIDGMVPGNQLTTIKQNPNYAGAIPVKRSNNAHEGIEFTWSLWLFLEDGPASTGNDYLHVFHKGDNKPNVGTDFSNGATDQIAEIIHTNQGMNQVLNGPGLYIKPFTSGDSTTSLTFAINTFDTASIVEKVDVDNITINKWFNIMIMCKNRYLDIYINGTIKKRYQMAGLPKQNYGDVYVGATTSTNKFDGFVSNLWYYDYALGTREIEGIMNSGASTTLVNESTINAKTSGFYFLSTRWFMGDN